MTDHADYLQQVEDLGWTDVLLHYRRNLDQKEHAKRLARIDELRKNIAYAEPLFKEKRHEDFQFWVSRIYNDIAASPDFDSQDFSLMRLQCSAQSAMSFVRSLPKMKSELKRLCEEMDSSQNPHARHENSS